MSIALRKALGWLTAVLAFCTALVGVYCQHVAIAVAAALLVLLYVVFMWPGETADSSRWTLASEQTYFLGYLCTIGAFVVLVCRLTGDNTEQDFRSVAIAGALALLTTLAGLFGMALLREFGPQEDRLSVTRNVKPVPIKVELSKEIAENLQQLWAVSEQTCQRVQDLNDRLRTVNESATAFERALGRGADGSGAFAQKIEQAHKTLLSYAKCAELNADLQDRLYSLVTRLSEVTNSANDAIDQFHRQVSIAAQETKGLGNAVTQGNSDLADFRESVRELDQVLRCFVELQKLMLQEYEQVDQREEG